MRRFDWLDRTIVEAIHTQQLSAHGGSHGVRDRGLLESALARPQNRAVYENSSVFQLAAAYAFGIARNHAFFDGNKRTALMAAYVFLGMNGWRLQASEAEAVAVFRDLAAGELGEAEVAAWLERHSMIWDSDN
jgi:death-on-curing protein